MRRRYGSCCKERYGFVLEHIEAQTTSCLFTEDGRPAVDFLGRSERFDEDFQDLIDLLNSRRPEGLPPLNITAAEKLNAIEAKSRYRAQNSTDRQGAPWDAAFAPLCCCCCASTIQLPCQPQHLPGPAAAA
jgi:hypothetical protein